MLIRDISSERFKKGYPLLYAGIAMYKDIEKMTMMWIPKALAKKIDQVKKHKNQARYEVVAELLEFYKKHKGCEK
jgi:hypothetical protein